MGVKYNDLVNERKKRLNSQDLSLLDRLTMSSSGYARARHRAAKGYSDKVASIPSEIAGAATTGFNKAMDAATSRRELEMQMAREGITAENLGRYGEESLAQAAGGAGAMLSPVTGTAEALAPPDMGIVRAIAESKVGQQAAQLAGEYPRTTRNLSNALEAGSWFPGMKFGGRMLNALMDNTPTEMPGFYSGNPAGAFATATVPAIPGMFNQLFNPRAAMERRTVGTGRGRRKEYVTNPKQSVTVGSMLASSHMDKQGARTPEGSDNVVQSSAEVQRYVQDSFDLSDTDKLKANLASLEPDTPDVVLDAAANHARRVHSVDNREGAATAVVRRPLSGEKLSGEATGVATTASSVSRSLTSSKSLEAAHKALPDAEGIDFYRQYLTIAKHANNDRVRLAIRDKKLPDGTTGADLQQLYWNALNNKNQGKKVTEKQQQALNFFEDAKPIQMTDRGNGIYTLQDTTKSAAQDLGGMNQFLAIDVNKGKVWTMGSDGHDMFGVNPPGGNELINIVPIHSFDIGTKKSYPKSGSVEVNLKRIEELTGMPRNKGESATAYQKRVMRDYKGSAELQDYLTVGENVVGAGMLTSAIAGDRENEKERR